MRVTALVSLVPLLATSAQALSLPFRYSTNIARAEQELGARNNVPVINKPQRRSQKLVRRRKWGHHRTTTTSCDDEGPTDSVTPPANSTSDWNTPTSTGDSWTPTSTGDSWNTPTTTDGPTSTDGPSSTDDGSGSTSNSPSPTSSDPPSNTNVPNSEWKLTRSILGRDFFADSNWEFWAYPDPTHGDVEYVNKGAAEAAGLWEVDGEGDAIMRVETTPQVNGPRKSIRLHSAFSWTGGMVLMDAKHMPTGCGTWPAWWQNGPDWPAGGEIDILEGVNDGTTNQVSLHTKDGCRAPSNANSQMKGKLHTGNFDAYNCASYATGNQGCGVMDSDTGSYGPGFNAQSGGVYALTWDQSGIAVWFHPRGQIPADITAEKPNPANWGTPVANFPASDCDPFEYFQNHISIWDTTLCGDWAGADSVWQQSCAASTGYSSCIDYVRNNGDAMKNAFWKISYVKYFESATSKP